MTAPPDRVTRVVCVQLAPVVGDPTGNRAASLQAVRDAVGAGGDVVVLPELATSGYVFESEEEARAAAIARDDGFFGEMATLLAGTDSVVVLGFAEREAGPDAAPGAPIWNSAAVVSADGVLAVYRKTHLWDRETLWFAPGGATAPVVDTAHGRIGVLVCYDLEFPEMPRALALAGADLIAVPTNWPRGEHPDDERAAEVIHAQSAARVNGVFIAVCDRAGTERGQEWTEGTVILDQFGWVRAATTGGGRTVSAGAGHAAGDGRAGSARNDRAPATAIADVFPRLARDKAISPHNDLLGDRRTDIYAEGRA